MITIQMLENITKALDGHYTGEQYLDDARSALKSIFASKEDYLEWVDIWKIYYKFRTTDIRKLKSQRKTSRSDYNPDARCSAQYQGRLARADLWLRTEGKKISWQMKQARVQNT